MTRIYYNYRIESYVVTRQGMPVIVVGPSGVNDYDDEMSKVRSALAMRSRNALNHRLSECLFNFSDSSLGWKQI